MSARTPLALAVLSGLLSMAGCADSSPPLGVDLDPGTAALDRGRITPVPTAPTPERTVSLVERTNAELAARGSDLRLNEVWLFTVGPGTDPYRQLRLGTRWAWNPVTYYLDMPDFTPQLASADVEATLMAAYDRWNDVPASSIRAERVAPSVGNVDILDGWLDLDPETETTCDSNLDFTAEVWLPGFAAFIPAADIVVGGWMPGAWFEECFGSDAIIGITMVLGYGDANHDQYVDQLYVEQYFNEDFTWLLDGAPFLGAPVDLESIAVHEDGHALGLGHYGGAGKIPEGLFHSLNFRMIFSPEAIMNPGYLGGEKRDLYSIDEAALRTLY